MALRKYLILVTFYIFISGCASAPPPTDEVLQKIRSSDFGVVLDERKFNTVKEKLKRAILEKVKENMTDPNSTELTAIQVKGFDKCVLSMTITGSNDYSPRGYCVSFQYNSKNRMGGYAGASLAYAVVNIKENDDIEVHWPFRALSPREKNYEYPYTNKTGVYELQSVSSN